MGQRGWAALVDLAFFVAVVLCAKWRVVGGEAVVGLLSSYASARFGIAYGKQQAQTAAVMANSSSSQQMRAVRPDSDIDSDDPPPPPPPPPPVERLTPAPHRGSGTPPLPRPARPLIPREDDPRGRGSRRSAIVFTSPLTALLSFFRPAAR